MSLDGNFTARARDLRAEFNQSFAEAPRGHDVATEDFLAIRLNGLPHAIRLAEVSGLFTDKRVTPIPSEAPGLLGIAGFRGAIHPVYDLQALVGHAPAQRSPTLPWLVVVRQAPLALAFEALDGHLRVPLSAVSSEVKTAERIAREVVHAPTRGDGARAIVHIASLLEAIKMRSNQAISQKER